MTPTRLILDDLINRLRASDRADEQAFLDLQLNHHLTPGHARSMLARARFLLDREAQHVGKPCRRYRKPPPGDAGGLFENVVRLLEDVGTG